MNMTKLIVHHCIPGPHPFLAYQVDYIWGTDKRIESC
jgi:hypothetical protein